MKNEEYEFSKNQKSGPAKQKQTRKRDSESFESRGQRLVQPIATISHRLNYSDEDLDCDEPQPKFSKIESVNQNKDLKSMKIEEYELSKSRKPGPVKQKQTRKRDSEALESRGTAISSHRLDYGDEDLDCDELQPKIPKIEAVSQNVGFELMKKMGWKGSGLGAQGQGKIEPVAASTHTGRQGIGLSNQEIEKPDTVWELGMDEASANGDLIFVCSNRMLPDYYDLTSGEVIGERKRTIDSETTYCNPELLSEMLKCKSQLDKYDNFLDGRSRSNPYEKIASGFFLNRAAMKMANIDSICDNIFTSCKENEILYFADICAGPGGFTEFMLWKRPMQSCGFGFTLRGKDDFKLNKIICGPVECFHPSYGKADDGDITNQDNLIKFQAEVTQGTSAIGVHSVLADGGFDVTGNESIQELMSKQLYLCQFLCAINILRTNGNFVCKLFDTFTDFSVGLVFLLSTLFDQVSIIKPITSRPANSERYVVFKGFTSDKSRIDNIREFLYKVNSNLNFYKGTEQDVIKVIQNSVLKKDKQFIEFITKANNNILEQQIIALAKLDAFIIDRNLCDDRQMDIRKEAFELWKIPDLKRDHFISTKGNLITDNFISINFNNKQEHLKPAAQKAISSLTKDQFLKDKFVVRNHMAAFVGGSIGDGMDKTLYVLVKDKKFVNWYPTADSRPNRLFEQLKKWFTNIPSFTVLLVNFGIEYSGPKGNIKCNSVVVVDSPLIHGEDISELSYEDRMHKVSHLCSLLDPKPKGLIRPIDYFPLSDIKNYVSRYISLKKAKGLPEQQMVTCRKADHFYSLGKLLIINMINHPWLVAISRSQGNAYYYNVTTRASIFDKPEELYASYSKSHIHEIDWESSERAFDCINLLSLIDKKQ